jgi:hypothetical protein
MLQSILEKCCSSRRRRENMETGAFYKQSDEAFVCYLSIYGFAFEAKERSKNYSPT